MRGMTLRPWILAAATAVLTSGVALAQAPAPAPTPAPAQSPAASPPAAEKPGNNAVNTTGQNTSPQPVAGSNSFTEGQARARIEAAGYASVTGLKLDAQGVWRGMASRNGQQTDVSLDFQGNVNPR